MNRLRYGTDSAIDLEFEEGVLLGAFGCPAGKPLDSVEKAVTAALNEPLGYPALAQCITPSDRIVLALEPGVPQVAEVTTAVIQALLDANIHPDGITVLQTQAAAEAGNDPCRLLDASIRSDVTLEVHAPDERDRLGFLGGNAEGEPVMVSRAIHDADMVLPIGSVRGRGVFGYHGIHTVIFPTFADEETQARFRTIGPLDPRPDHAEKLAKEVEEAAWLLGLTFTIQLIPASGSSLLHVVAGECQQVAEEAPKLYDAAWHGTVAEQAPLVVAAIEGGPEQQTWANLGRTLDAAVPLVEDGGAIAICCDLETPPGPGIRQLGGGEYREEAIRHIRKEKPEDTLAAAQLARALDQAKVYLLSRLDPGVVEDLEMIHVGSPKELMRLASLHPSCILLANAPYTTVELQ